MSARVESPPVGGGTLGGSFVIAVVVALSIGALAGSLITHAIDSDGGASRATTFVARGTPALTEVDVGNGSKAIEGPMLAERFTGLASANVWDAGKLTKRDLRDPRAHRPRADDPDGRHTGFIASNGWRQSRQ